MEKGSLYLPRELICTSVPGYIEERIELSRDPKDSLPHSISLPTHNPSGMQHTVAMSEISNIITNCTSVPDIKISHNRVPVMYSSWSSSFAGFSVSRFRSSSQENTKFSGTAGSIPISPLLYVASFLFALVPYSCIFVSVCRSCCNSGDKRLSQLEPAGVPEVFMKSE